MLEFNATFIVAIFSFVVFIFIMNAIFYEPVFAVMKKREEYVASNLNDSNLSVEKAESIDSEIDKQMASAKSDAQIGIKNAVEEAKRKADKRKNDSKSALKEKYDADKSDLLKKKADIETQVNSSVQNDLANDICSRLLGGVK